MDPHVIEVKRLAEIEEHSPERAILKPVFKSERTKVILLCLSPGQSVAPHQHPGHDVTLQPLKGKATLPGHEGGEETTLEPGTVYVADGARTFGPSNSFEEPFTMLIHLFKR